MLKMGGRQWMGFGLGLALLAAPQAAVADGRAASTRSDGDVSSRGDSSRGDVGSRASDRADHGSSSGSSGGDSGRVSVPRDDGGGSPVASGGNDGHRGGNDGRYAVPRSNDDGGYSGPHRGTGSGRGGRHGGGYYGGGYYGGRTIVLGGWYDPWYYGPWPGLWSGWWGPWGGRYGGYGRPYGYGYGYREDDDYGDGEYGALDIDIAPEEVEVWVDGERVGTADDFDGFPSFLWLPRGTYDVVFYHEGYRTLARQYSIYGGVIVDVEDRLERGDATRPEDLASTSTVRREARLERDRERQEAARAREQWRERRERVDEEDEEWDEEELDGEVEVRADRPRDVARLHVRVAPDDASVYLDGNFVGTGRELEQLSAGLVVGPGSHRLEVVRPGYASEEVTFDSDPGEALDLRVDLERE
jgi:hypothetical protein